jgi:hypothetical protein
MWIHDCDNVLIENIRCTRYSPTYNSLLYIKNSKGIIKNCEFNNIDNLNTTSDGIYFDNSRFYLSSCVFKGCVHNVNLNNFSIVDDNPNDE